MERSKLSNSQSSASPSSIDTRTGLWGRFNKSSKGYTFIVSKELAGALPATGDESDAFQETMEIAWMRAGTAALKKAGLDRSYVFRDMFYYSRSRLDNIPVGLSLRLSNSSTVVCIGKYKPRGPDAGPASQVTSSRPRATTNRRRASRHLDKSKVQRKHIQVYWTAPDATRDDKTPYWVAVVWSQAEENPDTIASIKSAVADIIQSVHRRQIKVGSGPCDVCSSFWSVKLPPDYIRDEVEYIDGLTMSHVKAEAERLGTAHPGSVFVVCTDREEATTGVAE